MFIWPSQLMSCSFLRAWLYSDPSDSCLLTELQNVEGWKGPLRVVCSSAPGQAGPAVCPGPCPIRFLTSPRVETPQLSWLACALLNYSRSEKNIFWCLHGISCVSLCPLLLPLLLGTTGSNLAPSPFHLPSGIYGICHCCLYFEFHLPNFTLESSILWLAVASSMAQISLYVSQMFECMRFSSH